MYIYNLKTIQLKFHYNLYNETPQLFFYANIYMPNIVIYLF
jgi:hypothetical protein